MPLKKFVQANSVLIWSYVIYILVRVISYTRILKLAVCGLYFGRYKKRKQIELFVKFILARPIVSAYYLINIGGDGVHETHDKKLAARQWEQFQVNALMSAWYKMVSATRSFLNCVIRGTWRLAQAYDQQQFHLSLHSAGVIYLQHLRTCAGSEGVRGHSEDFVRQ